MMANRTFDLQVSGLTKEGYPLMLIVHNVDGTKLSTALSWIESQLIASEAVAPTTGDGPHRVDPPGWPDTKLCSIHKVEMKRHTKGNAHWWSHKVQLEDGTEHWCRGK